MTGKRGRLMFVEAKYGEIVACRMLRTHSIYMHARSRYVVSHLVVDPSET